MPSMLTKKYITLLLFVSFLCSCASTQLLEKKDYKASIKALNEDNYQKALEHFPKREKHHFITVLEKAYLSLLADNDFNSKELNALVQLSKEIEQKEVVYISNELQNLFYMETDEGYFPGEHEIYWMHLILGFHYLKKSEWQNARIHAQKISELFKRVNVNGEKYFDDASLRVLAATLWVGVNEWDRAQVDLRRAQEINSELKLAKIIAADKAPENWNMFFRGTGYTVEYDGSKLKNKFLGFMAVEFKPSVSELDSPCNLQLIGNTRAWYARHQYRNNEIKNVLDRSKYMTRMFKSELEYGSLNVLTTAATGALITTGIAIGVAFVGGSIYLMTQLGDSSGEAATYLIALGITIGSEIYTTGINFYDSTMKKIKTEREEYQDVSRFYRYVRFIPDEFYLNFSPINDKMEFPFFELKSAASTVRLIKAHPIICKSVK